MGHVIALQYWRYGIGGAERVTRNLLARFVAHGHTVYLVNDVPPEPDDLDVPAGVERLLAPGQDQEREQFWADLAKHRGVEVVIYSTWLSERAVRDCESILRSGARLVYQTHGDSTFFVDKPDGPRLLSTMLSCAGMAHAVTAVSPSNALFYLPWNSHSCSVANPLDHLPPPPGGPRSSHGRNVVWVGRFDPVEKRLDLTLKAFAALFRQVPDARLSLVGGGDPWQEEQVRSLVGDLGITAAVEFVGAVRDATGQLAAADVFVLSSPTEGFPMALCEAMNAGLPCVCFELPNVVAAHDCTGVMQVPFGDVDSMARALEDVLLSDDDRYRDLSRAVCEKIARVRAIDVDAQWEHVLDLALGEEPARHSYDAESLLTRSFVLGYLRQADMFAEQHAWSEHALKETAERERQVRADLEAVRGSASFKAGRALTALPRRLRNLFRHEKE